MHAIIVRYKIKPQHVADYEREMRAHVASTRRNEKGCLQFEVCVDKSDPSVFHLFELYADDKALEEHAKSPTLGPLREKLKQWQEDRSFFQAVPWPAIKG